MALSKKGELDDLLGEFYGEEAQPEEKVEETQPEAVEEEVIEEEVETPEAVEETEETVEKEEEDEVVLFSDEEEAKEEETETPTINEEAFFKFASERLGREINSFDDFKTNEPQEAISEQVKQIDKFVKDTGRDVSDWFKMQSLDIENMTSEQLIKQDMRLRYPSLTESQIDKRFNAKYKLDKELHDADIVELAEIDLAVDAETAKNALTGLKVGYEKPLPQSDAGQEEAARLAQEQKEQFVNEMNTELSKLEYLTFDVDGAKVKYKPSKDDLQMIRETGSNLETFWELFNTPEGNFDWESFYKAIYFSRKGNPSKLIKAVKSRYVNEGKNSQISKLKNTKLPGTGGAASGKTAEEVEQENNFMKVLQEEMGGGRKKRIKF